MTNDFMQTKLDFYLDAYGAARDRVGDDLVAVAVMQEIAKDRRMVRISQERNGSYGNGNGNGHDDNGSGDGPATKKQINYLKRLNVEFPEGISKKEASALIDEAKEEGAD